MFSDLYDKETLEGKSSSAYDDYPENRKQSKVPVIICLICALICLFSLMFLFILPTNMNLITKAQAIAKKTEKQVNEDSPETANVTETKTEKPVEDSNKEAEEEKETEVPAEKETVPAKENEIVIATVPSQVIPEKPAKTTASIPDTKYTVVWGDTLWDISNAYYKNPWRYTYLAEYNHLKNPNYIKAGSIILIPAE
ncbi:MAG: LysM peptidoglycan-binding domain-containing protein [Treponema sp.]|nr:LysM peptidoglycan-binding domain-containing protein [Treponema sp.]